MNSIVLDTVPIWTLILGVGVFLYVLLDGFDLGVGMLFGLAPDDAREKLQKRAETRSAELEETDRQLAASPHIPRLFLLEEEYRRAVLVAELDWLGAVIDDLRAGRLTWSEQWLLETWQRLMPQETEPNDTDN